MKRVQEEKQVGKGVMTSLCWKKGEMLAQRPGEAPLSRCPLRRAGRSEGESQARKQGKTPRSQTWYKRGICTSHGQRLRY